MDIKSKIDGSEIKTDNRVLEFAKKNEISGNIIQKELEVAKANLFYKKARESIQDNNISEAIDNFFKGYCLNDNIDNDLFRRVIWVYLNRYFEHVNTIYKEDFSLIKLYRDLYKDAEKENEILKEEIDQLKRLKKVSKDSKKN